MHRSIGASGVQDIENQSCKSLNYDVISTTVAKGMGQLIEQRRGKLRFSNVSSVSIELGVVRVWVKV